MIVYPVKGINEDDEDADGMVVDATGRALEVPEIVEALNRSAPTAACEASSSNLRGAMASGALSSRSKSTLAEELRGVADAWAEGSEVRRVCLAAASALVASRPEERAQDPGTEKILRTLLDRAYKMMLMSVGPVAEHNPDHNDPFIAWMSDTRHVLYGNGRQPDPVRDLQGKQPT